MIDDVLLRAAELIEERWAIGEFVTKEPVPRFCLSGAILTAVAEKMGTDWCYVDPIDAYQRFERVKKVIPGNLCPSCGWGHVIAEIDGHVIKGDPIVHWNDHHCDGGKTAAKLLREAAELELVDCMVQCCFLYQLVLK